MAADGLLGRSERVVLHVGEHDRAPCCGEPVREREPDAAARARHDRDGAVPEFHIIPLDVEARTITGRSAPGGRE